MKRDRLRWLKYDLHMHSHYSNKKKQEKSKLKEMTAQEFVDAIKDKVDVFSITDHNYYSKKYYDEIRNYIKDKEIEVIDGVELDVYVDENHFFQMLVYFEKNEDNSKIEEVISEIYNDGKPQMSFIIGKLLTLNTKFILIPEGNKSRGIIKIINRLDQKIYDEMTKYAMYKIFSGYDVTANFDATSQDIWAANYYADSANFENIAKNKTEEEIKSLINEINEKIKDNRLEISSEAHKVYSYIIKYSSYFTYFSFSDWHNKDSYNPQINNFIFGSIKTAFESLEIAVLDPLSRVIKTTDDKINISENIINEVKFEMNNKNYNVSFTPGLNTIIGKRGSGKSLLISIIRRFFDKDDKAIESYRKKYEVSNISGKNYGGIDIKEGNLQSISILEQSQIEEIYKNPDKAWETISSKFPKIDELDLKKLQEINELLKTIKPIDENLKNITSNLNQIEKSDSFIYDTIENIDSDNFDELVEQGTHSFNKLFAIFADIGFDISSISKQLEDLTTSITKYINVINKYNELFDNHNLRIKEKNKNITNLEASNTKNRNEIEKALFVIKSNFKKLLDFKIVELKLQKFSLGTIPIELRRDGNYLFVSSYNMPEDLKQTVLSKATESLKKDSKKEDIVKIKDYVLGKHNLLANKSLHEEFNKFIQGEIFTSKKDFYQVLDTNIDLKMIKNNKDIKEALEQGQIISLNESSLGTKSVAYLDMLFDSEETIMLLDQPEDNIDNDYISNFLVPIIKSKKRQKQLIFVTHNPSVAVYGDSFNYIYATNEDNEIQYTNYFIESITDKENIMNILDGGRPSFYNRNKKYGDILGEEEYEVRNKKK